MSTNSRQKREIRPSDWKTENYRGEEWTTDKQMNRITAQPKKPEIKEFHKEATDYLKNMR